MAEKLLRIVAGPNGAGKSTLASLFFGKLELLRYINADVIARGIDLTISRDSNIVAGRVMLESIHEALREGHSFSFETTMSGKIWAPLIKNAISLNYRVELLFVYLQSPEMCLRRIEDRVRSGGHNIPEETVRRRYQRSLAMFAGTYSSLIPNWYLFDNSNGAALVIAQKEEGEVSIADMARYDIIKSYAN